MRRLALWLGAALVALLLAMALLSLVWTPYDPTLVVAGQRLQGPSAEHWLGTDAMGIDVFSRILVGAQTTIVVGVVSVSIAALLGVPLGMLAGQAGGWVDEVVMRVTDIAYAFPALLLAILLAARFGASPVTAMTAIGLATIPSFARVTRAGTKQVMSSDFVLAARASGTRWPGVSLRHVLPNIAPLIGVQASVTFALAILAEAALSYLGLSTAAIVPTWGKMLRDAQSVMFNAPLQALWPGLAIALAVLGFNLLGDGLRDLLDPRLREVS
ncbi:MAG: ABC transporter permease [Micropruina glycogenica]|uniref:Putative peptide transporter permease subunit: membrane component of ABC superfamily n=1 Tax=Micropruina glycogenica TaxID=75385 RepID=A0A2N9JFE2_9ACTN|nr:ABC transporter permease [Micropruina glycogenica]MCB0891397.1 ABC transporter permease [Propionibacteriaceae bacterium]SPD86218.1 putative peptide transporter permease subunit: membrane component of ABC superfamily [Micropruina glycogenica]